MRDKRRWLRDMAYTQLREDAQRSEEAGWPLGDLPQALWTLDKLHEAYGIPAKRDAVPA